METTETFEERAFTSSIPELTNIFSNLKPASSTLTFENTQSGMWRLMRQSSDNVFKLLKLDKIDKLDKIATEGTKLFENPSFKKWVNFVYKRKSEKPEATTEAIFATLAAHYGDGANLARLLELGKLHRGDKHIADLAAALQVAQLEKWNKNEKTVEDVLEILELDKTQGNPLLDPLFVALSAYVKFKHPNDPTAASDAMLTAFRKFYKDDKAWARFLFPDTSTEPFAGLAAALQVAQLEKWNKNEKTVEDVLEILELDKTQGNPLLDPLFVTLSAYVKFKHPNDPTAATKAMLTAFRNFYTDDTAWAKILVDGTRTDSVKNIAYDLLYLQLSLWEEGEKTLFTHLGLDQIEGELFESPLFKRWAAIVDGIHLYAPNTASDVILSTLAAHFGEKAAWADILIAGKKVPDMEYFARRLEMRQIERWHFGVRYFIDDSYNAKAKASKAESNYTAKKNANRSDLNRTAKKAAIEAIAVAEEAKKAADEAVAAIKRETLEPMVSTLRLRKKLLRNCKRCLKRSRPQEDRSKVSAPGAEPDSNFDVHG
ncbi:unnamed protein product [Peronospora farinosa]|uniref:Uncharacterized protein n=1 Tax=Peronospora farinosa TaxID=134698 RepID=A0AAV0SP62_9STRA|nr:unnamed protein product [Peronospora farinosa]